MARFFDKMTESPWLKSLLLITSFSGVVTTTAAQTKPDTSKMPAQQTAGQVQHGINVDSEESAGRNGDFSNMPGVNFIVSDKDPRIAPLAKYAESLKEKIPADGPISQGMVNMVPEKYRKFITELPTPREKSEAIKGFLLQDAMANGAPLPNGKRSQGYGGYDNAYYTGIENAEKKITELTNSQEESRHDLYNAEDLKANIKLLSKTTDPTTKKALQEEIKDEIHTACPNNPAGEKILLELFHKGTLGVFADQGIINLKNEINDYDKQINEQRKIADAPLPGEGKDGASVSTNFPKNGLICRQEAPIAAFLLDKAGVKNSLFGGYEYGEGDAAAEGHTYVVSDATRNSFDFTSTDGAYQKSQRNVSLKDMKLGYTNVYKSFNGNLSAYGGFAKELKGYFGDLASGKLPEEEIGSASNRVTMMRTLGGKSMEEAVTNSDIDVMKALRNFKGSPSDPGSENPANISWDLTAHPSGIPGGPKKSSSIKH